jgi:hypothetical protein
MAGSFFYSGTPANSPVTTGPMVYRVPSYLLPSSAPGTPSAGGGCGGGGGSGGPVGSTTFPNTTPAAPIGASSGITSPVPSNIGGFLGFLNGPRVGIGFPDGGTPTPPAVAANQSQSSLQSGGIIGGRKVVGGGQGFLGVVLPPGPTGFIIQVLVVGFIGYAILKAIE